MKIFIAVPVFNEEKRAIKTIERILKNSKNEIIVVDDGSRDKTLELLKKRFGRNKRINILEHKKNRGKGRAMKTACKFAFQNKGDAIIFIDGDGQHSPKYLSKFEKKLESYNLVFGYRELGKNTPYIRKWGNILAKKIVKVIFGINRQDLLCGYFGFSKNIYPKIKWSSKEYGVETEIATIVGKRKFDFAQLKVNTTYIDKYKGVNIFDAFKILLKIPFWYLEK